MTVDLAEGLADVLSGLRDVGDPVLLLSRPGPDAVTEADRQWGRALAPLTRWPVHLYTRAGVRILAADDLALRDAPRPQAPSNSESSMEP